MLKQLILVRGLPGSGKSTWVRENYPGCLHLEADMFWMWEHQYIYDETISPKNHVWCADTAALAMKSGVPTVVVSNTFVSRNQMSYYIASANANGYEVVEHTCAGTYGSTHNVPEDTMQFMRDSWEN